jgi:hypothetical protein
MISDHAFPSPLLLLSVPPPLADNLRLLLAQLARHLLLPSLSLPLVTAAVPSPASLLLVIAIVSASTPTTLLLVFFSAAPLTFPLTLAFPFAQFPLAIFAFPFAFALPFPLLFPFAVPASPFFFSAFVFSAKPLSPLPIKKQEGFLYNKTE